MYMGLVQGVADVVSADRKPDRVALKLAFPEHLTNGLVLGASVSVEGVCLSVTSIEGNEVGFDATAGTLISTNLGALDHDRLNIERSAKLGDEIGGHIVAGHVSGCATIVAMETKPDAHMWMKLRLPQPWARYVFDRGFLAVNGCSLTVAGVEDDLFTINLIPETLRQTTFGLYRVGEQVNFEVDQQTMVLVDTIERTVTSVLERLLPKTPA
ncbi:MAG: riboflavin synthase subunit alpha [Alphaproteobacteria bacterium]|nr:riboflavin synthase subunit alpha [Alphaproteobacteria bacterium]MBU0795430.1 riboflavin synthase subunit alpha [Alphaproteobacteria bacterium]MBU0876615.1 riboflavin synthase subunit alpha [Alphaproteobacteria bacterium]MBU1769316.1 riboflavin synthase subunit alpha [Alphaproteobacteria bacterium]